MQHADELQLQDLFRAVESHNQQIRSRLHPCRDNTFMLQQSMKDAEAGFCTLSLNDAQLLSSGKQSIINNADVGG